MCSWLHVTHRSPADWPVYLVIPERAKNKEIKKWTEMITDYCLDFDHRFQVAAAEVDELEWQKDANECGRTTQGGARSTAAGFI